MVVSVSKKPTLALHWQIMIALVLALLVGLLVPSSFSFFNITLLSVLTFFGALFLNALKMLIVPLVVSSIVVGMMELKSDSLGRLGSKTLIYYATTSLVAILIGLLVVNALQPGLSNGVPVKDIIGLSSDTASVVTKVEGHGAGDIVDVFLRMIPSNIVAAAAEGQMLGLIFFSLLFGFFITKLEKTLAQTQKQFWKGLLEVMMLMTNLVMKFAPIGVFALVCKVVLLSGIEAFQPLALFFVSLTCTCNSHVCVSAIYFNVCR